MKSVLLLLLFCLYRITGQAQAVNVNWVDRIGGVGQDGVYAIQSDTAGNVFAAGWFAGSVDFDPGPGMNTLSGLSTRDIFICKFDPQGNLVWAKAQLGNGEEIVTDIALDPAGNVLTTGFFTGTVDMDPGSGTVALTTAQGHYESFASKLDGQGNLLWARQFSSCVDAYGAYSLKTDGAGNVFVTGIFDGTVDFDPGAAVHTMTAQATENAFILKLDADGNFAWSRQIDGAGPYIEGGCLAVDQAGNCYAAGGFETTTDLDPGPGTMNVTSLGGLDSYIIKLDPSGNLVWAKHYGSPDSDEITTIDVGSSGNLFITGRYSTTENDFDPGPAIYALPFAAWTDFYILKLTPNGDFVWCKGLGGDEYDSALSLVLDSEENVFLSGRFRVTMDFDPGPGMCVLSSVGPGSDATFVMSMDSTGQFNWATTFDGNMNYGNGIDLAPAGGLYVGGMFQNGITFDPGVCTSQLSAASGWSDGYLVRINPRADAGIAELRSAGAIGGFPNPFVSALTIHCGSVSTTAELCLLNSLGEIVRRQTTMLSMEVTFNTSDLPAGIYLIRLQDGTTVSYGKAVK